uniref:Uncharacterized protein n=1 Tax=Rhizophora mucronata TaxID=61149 RepID=A0A2P2QH14_RHIMU
MISKIIFRF